MSSSVGAKIGLGVGRYRRGWSVCVVLDLLSRVHSPSVPTNVRVTIEYVGDCEKQKRVVTVLAQLGLQVVPHLSGDGNGNIVNLGGVQR